jgi:predicted nucleic acid-binding protein
MRVPKIYLETTIFNYYFDTNREAHQDTVKLFKEIKQGRYVAYTSGYVIEEIERAPSEKSHCMISLIEEYNIFLIDANEEAVKLADIYVDEGIIPVRFRYDGLHIAMATVHNLDYILSLNFQHINKLKTKTMTDIINKREGYRGIYICSPMEVVENDE